MNDMLSNLLNREILEKLYPIVTDKKNQKMLDDKIEAVLKENGFNEKYFGMYAYRDVIKALLVHLVTNKEMTADKIIEMLLDFNSEFYIKIAPSFKTISVVADGTNLDPKAYTSFANAFIIEAIFAAKSLKFRKNYKKLYLNLTLMITEFIVKDLGSKYFPEEVISEDSSIEQPKKLVRKKPEEQS